MRKGEASEFIVHREEREKKGANFLVLLEFQSRAQDRLLPFTFALTVCNFPQLAPLPYDALLIRPLLFIFSLLFFFLHFLPFYSLFSSPFFSFWFGFGFASKNVKYTYWYRYTVTPHIEPENKLVNLLYSVDFNQIINKYFNYNKYLLYYVDFICGFELELIITYHLRFIIKILQM